MKSYRHELWFEVPGRRAFVNITPQVEACLAESGVKDGLVLVNAMHITASVFINNDEAGLHHDYEVSLEKLAPHAPTDRYRHNRTGEDNADAHLKLPALGECIDVAPAHEVALPDNPLARLYDRLDAIKRLHAHLRQQPKDLVGSGQTRST